MKMSVHEDIDIDGNGTEAVTGIGRCVGRSVKGDRSLWLMGVSERAPPHGDYWQHSERKELLP